MVRYSTAQHEARHVVLATLGNFEVQSVDADRGESIICMTFAPEELPQRYASDPDATCETVRNWIATSRANGRETSLGDWRAAWRYEKQWPLTARPQWSLLESQAKVQALQWLLYPEVAGMVRHLTQTLMQTPVLAGTALRRALYDACTAAMDIASTATTPPPTIAPTPSPTPCRPVPLRAAQEVFVPSVPFYDWRGWTGGFFATPRLGIVA